jgi:hypothetical protein
MLNILYIMVFKGIKILKYLKESRYIKNINNERDYYHNRVR